MKTRTLVALLLVAAFSLTVALAVARSARPKRPTPAAERSRPTEPIPAAGPRPTAVEVGRMRDVFCFADERKAPPPALAEDVPIAAPTDALQSGPRLVGIIRQPDRLLAALAVGDDVVLGGPGDAAAGVTIVSVSEDAVRIRSDDGTESTLALP